MIIISWFGDQLLNILCSLVWWIFIQGPLNIISAFNEIFNFLSGAFIQQLLFKKTNTFDWSNIPPAFWGFAIFATVIVCCIFWTQFVAMLFTETKEMKNKFVNCLKMTALGSIIIFFIPIGFFILNQIVIFFTTNMNNIFAMPKGSNIAGFIWHIGDSTWNGKDGGVPSDYGVPPNVIKYNIFIEIIATWFILVTMGLVSMILVQKNLELFFLFIISPIVAATMANDHGKRMNSWKDMVIAKSIATSATIVSYYTFLLALSLIYQLNLSQFTWIERQIILVALICGGGLACYNSSVMVASLVSEAVGMREGMSALRSTMAVTTGIMGAIGLKKRQDPDFGKNNSKDQDGEDFKVPFNGLRERSGLLGFLGDTIAHGSNALYSAAKSNLDYAQSDQHKEDQLGTKTAKHAGRMLLTAVKGVGYPVTSVLKGAYKSSQFQNRHQFEKQKQTQKQNQAEKQNEQKVETNS